MPASTGYSGLGGSPIRMPTVVGPWDYEEFTRDERSLGERLRVMIEVSFALLRNQPLTAFVFARCMPLLNERADKLWMVQMSEIDERAKDMLAALLRTLSREMEAVAVAWVSEAWLLHAEPGSERKRALDAYQRKHGSWEGFPGIEECLTLHFETRTAVYHSNARIRRCTGGLPTLGEWEQFKRLSGRLAAVFDHGPSQGDA